MCMSDLAALPFAHALHAAGARVYTVGGTVRDILLGQPRKDIDLLVTGMPQPDLIRILRKYGRVQLTGRAFGVIKFLPHRWHDPPIDIALPRTEISTGIGHRDFVVTFDHTLPVEIDLGRRDFTINAIAMDLATGHVLDPFGGRQDLERGILRQVSPMAFPEDPLRMLRGVQLATRFALHLEPTTHQAMQRHAAAITTVAAERIAEELRKLLQATAPSHGFLLMHDTGLLPHVLPEIARLVGWTTMPAMPPGNVETRDRTAGVDVFRRTLQRLDAVQQQEILTHRGHLALQLAALFQDSGLPDTASAALSHPVQGAHHVAQASATLASQRLEALKMTTIGADPALVKRLIIASANDPDMLGTAAALRHFAYRTGPEVLFMVVDLWLAERFASTPPRAIDDLLDLRQRLRDELARHVPLSLKELALDGHDLQRLGVPPGPQLGHILQVLLQQVLDDPACNTRAHLLAMVQSTFAHLLSAAQQQHPEDAT
jgi:tRNA nucleotidyltransferase (CCA-adding enzyme)